MSSGLLDLRLETGVWLLPLENTSTRLEPLFASLTDDERETLSGYASATRRQEFALSRLLLRLILRRYGFDALATTSLHQHEHGKPVFPDSDAPHFNLSHAQGMAVLVLGGTATLGVDIEPRGRKLPSQLLAPRYCHPAELRWLAESTDDELRHRQNFLRLWVRKEAVLKARGDGVYGGPRRIDAISGDGVAYYHDPARPEPERWDLADIEIHDDYFISVARAAGSRRASHTVELLDSIEALI